MSTFNNLSDINIAELLDSVPVGVLLCDEDGIIQYVNSVMESIFGHPSEAIIGEPVETLIPTTLRPNHSTYRKAFIADGRSRVMGNGRILTGLHASGTTIQVEVGISLIKSNHQTFAIAFIANVSNQHLEEKQIQRVLASMPFGLLVTDEDGSIVIANDELNRIFGYDNNELLGQSVEILVPERLRHAHRQFRNAFAKVHQSRLMGSGRELKGLRRNGSELPIEIALTPLLDDGKIRTLAAISDISQRKQLEESLRYRSCYDQLTGMPNRNLFFDRLEQAVLKFQRQQSCFALLMIDLNRFKDVNDTLGHPVGDLLLREVSQRLAMTMRQSDSIARIGGDEFAAILHDVNDETSAKQLAVKLIEAVKIPFVIGTNQLRIGLSIGIAHCPRNSTQAEKLIAQADHAMYQAKRGIHSIVYADSLTNTAASPPHALLSQLQRAVLEQQFEFYFQPKLALPSRQLVGVEALIRWRLPNGALCSPAEFLQTLEDSDLLESFTFATITMAVQHIANFARLQRPLAIAVNVSARMLDHHCLVEHVIDQLNHYQIAPELLTLEITETALAFNPLQARRTIEQLAAAGVAFSIDDFGAGYTSFRYLKQFRFAEIKIDREFISGIQPGSFDAALIKSIVCFCQNLNVRLIVEGIESASDLETIQALGCRTGQGYHLFRPMSLTALQDLLDR